MGDVESSLNESGARTATELWAVANEQIVNGSEPLNFGELVTTLIALAEEVGATSGNTGTIDPLLALYLQRVNPRLSLSANTAVGYLNEEQFRRVKSHSEQRISLSWSEGVEQIVLLPAVGAVTEVFVGQLSESDAPQLSTTPLGETVAEFSASELEFHQHAIQDSVPIEVNALGIILKSAQMVGALKTAIDLMLSYANAREQFGSKIAKFQAIQRLISVSFSEVALAEAQLKHISDTLKKSGGILFEDALVAKAQASQAANIVARNAHQIHGAIAYTQEYPLYLTTLGLWTWRDQILTEFDSGKHLYQSLVSGDETMPLWHKMTDWIDS